MEIVVFLMAERIKAPHRKAGIFQRQRQRWQVRLGTKKGNSFLMEGKWGHPISLQSLLLLPLAMLPSTTVHHTVYCGGCVELKRPPSSVFPGQKLRGKRWWRVGDWSKG